MPGDKESNRSENLSERIIVTGACVRGERHVREGLPCQDAFSWHRITEKIVIIALADGLSSEPYADTGARIAGETICKAFISAYEHQNVMPDDRKVLMRDAFRTAHEAVISEAHLAGIDPSRYGSTLIGALFGNGVLTVGHIGDGIVAGLQEGKSIIISEPCQSEYANETSCLVQPDWETHLRITEVSHIEAGILATDGCQAAIATRISGNLHPYDPFILPLISFARKKNTHGEDASADISSLLISSRMQTLSGDDKTLVIFCEPPVMT